MRVVVLGKRLHRYLAEFDFRYNNRIALGVDDIGRVSRIVKAAEGKRLTYRRPDRAPAWRQSRGMLLQAREAVTPLACDQTKAIASGEG